MRLVCALAIVGALLACTEPGTGGDSSGDGEIPTYWRDAKSIVDRRCATCHRPGDIGPFSLTTYQEVKAFAVPVRASVQNGTMPPWQPSDDCTSYLRSIDLTQDEKSILLTWLEAGAPEGDPADAPDDTEEPDGPRLEVSLSLPLPEAYTPVREPDDYRCQLIPWPETETRFVTGLRVSPDRRDIVHHAIVFLARPEEVERYRAYDEADSGPGYTCYGGPTAGEAGGLGDIDPVALQAALRELGISFADLRARNLTQAQILALSEALGVGGVDQAGFDTLGSWTPGVPAAPFPEGTGIRVEPGSMLVVQMHYNTLVSAPAPDRSIVEIALARTVEREATNLRAVDLGWISNGAFGQPMTIPAGAPEVKHSTTLAFDSIFIANARRNLGLPSDAPLVLHSANHHMHELGRRQRSEIRRADGSSACILDIPDWDFQWQGAYALAVPLRIGPGDALFMECTWDNSAANQPIVDGRVREPSDVVWGESTSDEMCLGAFYVTKE